MKEDLEQEDVAKYAQGYNFLIEIIVQFTMVLGHQ